MHWLTEVLCPLGEVSLPRHLFRYLAALYSWLYFAPVLFARSIVQVVLDLPRDLLPTLFPSINCGCDVLLIIVCTISCNVIVFNCRTIYLPVPILLDTSLLLILFAHGICNTLRYIHILNAQNLDNNKLHVKNKNCEYLHWQSVYSQGTTKPEPQYKSMHFISIWYCRGLRFSLCTNISAMIYII